MKNQRPHYTDKTSIQTLSSGLEEYYRLNPHLTPPETQPPEFARILLSHDIGHVIYGCDTGMYDELKILPLFWWTSKCTFGRFLEMRKTPAVDVMYRDMIREKGVIWLYLSILKVIPPLLPSLVSLWFKTRNHRKRLPFFEFEPMLERTLLDIRTEYGLLSLLD